MPDLKYKKGKIELAYKAVQMSPNFVFLMFLPIRKRLNKLTIPTTAFGNRAANSVTPNSFILKTCNQIKRGGFSQNFSKFICTSK